MDELHYVVTFRHPPDGDVTSLRVRSVEDSLLGPGFICLSDFVFDTGRRLHLPHEEALMKRFENTRRLHVSVFSILSIAEEGADHPGLQLDADRTNLVVLPRTPDKDPTT